MNIHLSTGHGTGKTKLAAFDNALFNTGIANYNLLCLSSVIPPESNLVLHEDSPVPADLMPGVWGDRLYVVMAEIRTDVPNEEAWAGIGWIQDSETKKGLFVEHEGHSEESVRNDIKSSLKSLAKTRGIDFGPVHMIVSGAVCKTTPVCAMAVAVYQASGWDNTAHLLKG